MLIQHTELSSPVGPLALAWSDDTVLELQMDVARNRTGWDTGYADDRPGHRLDQALRRRFRDATFVEAGASAGPPLALRRYFDGDLTALDDLAVNPAGTPFQLAVWAALRAIPPGRLATYGELATALDRPRASRAVGGAVGANPIPIIVPCHRVVGSDGGLTGFGGGLRRKRWLLEHEGAIPAGQPRLAFPLR